MTSHFFQLLFTRIIFNLRAEAKKSQLSYAWWILEPMLEAAVFYVVFGIFLQRGTDNFVPFLLVGLIPWTWFARSVNNSMRSLGGAKWLLTNFKIYPAFFPLNEVGQDAFKQIFTFSFLLVFLLIYGTPPTLSWIWLPVVIIVQLILVTAVSCLVASIIPILEDLKYLVATGLLATMFASGIFYDAQTLVTEEWRNVYYMNPVASLLQLYRDVLLFNRPPDVYYLAPIVAWAAGCGLLAAISMNYFKDRYARMIQE